MVQALQPSASFVAPLFYVAPVYLLTDHTRKKSAQ
jgi:hypothetical protein